MMNSIFKLSDLNISALETNQTLKKLTIASRKLAELKGIAATIPNQRILINTLSLQEAKDSSSIEKDKLRQLSDTQLEELVARLAEAEVASYGHSPAYVSWSGSINASDGGIDIHVQVPVDRLSTGFLEKPNTVFQAKIHSMSRAKITKAMCPR